MKTTPQFVFGLLLCSSLAAYAAAPYPDNPALRYPWTNYVGTQGANTTEEPIWADTTRDSNDCNFFPNYVRFNSGSYTTKFDQAYFLSIVKNFNLVYGASTGPASAQPTFDNPAHTSFTDFVLAPFLDRIKDDGNASQWRNEVYNKCKKFIQARLDASEFAAPAARYPTGQVYYQIGNEINSKLYSASFQKWFDNQPTLPAPGLLTTSFRPSNPPITIVTDPSGKPGDRRYIAYFVEWILLPALEGIQKANAELLGPTVDDSSWAQKKPYYEVRSLLGAISSAASSKSRGRWLSEIMNYTTLPAGNLGSKVLPNDPYNLTGKKVYTLIPYLALHYILTDPEHFTGPTGTEFEEPVDLSALDGAKNGDSWYFAYDPVFQRWVGNDKPAGCAVQGIFTTEEGGGQVRERGWGANTTLRTMSRYLTYALRNGYSPKQIRFSVYGGESNGAKWSTKSPYSDDCANQNGLKVDPAGWTIPRLPPPTGEACAGATNTACDLTKDYAPSFIRSPFIEGWKTGDTDPASTANTSMDLGVRSFYDFFGSTKLLVYPGRNPLFSTGTDITIRKLTGTADINDEIESYYFTNETETKRAVVITAQHRWQDWDPAITGSANKPYADVGRIYIKRRGWLTTPTGVTIHVFRNSYAGTQKFTVTSITNDNANDRFVITLPQEYRLCPESAEDPVGTFLKESDAGTILVTINK